MFELITKEDNKNYGTFKNIKTLLKQIRLIIDDDFNFGVFMECLKDENENLQDIEYLINVCDNWDFIVRII